MQWNNGVVVRHNISYGKMPVMVKVQFKLTMFDRSENKLPQAYGSIRILFECRVDRVDLVIYLYVCQ